MSIIPNALRRTCLLAAGIALLSGGCPQLGTTGSGAENAPETSTDDALTAAAANSAPVADAGDDQTAQAGQQVVLDASGSSDVDRDRLAYVWRQTSGSPIVDLIDGFSSHPRFFVPSDVTATAVVTFRLTVLDGLASSSDEVSVTIQP